MESRTSKQMARGALSDGGNRVRVRRRQAMAMVVIGERGEDATIRRRASAPGLDHVRQLDAQGIQTPQFARDVRQLRGGYFVRRFARWLIEPRCQIEQRADRVEWKTEFARVPNEIQSFQMALRIHAVPSGRP